MLHLKNLHASVEGKPVLRGIDLTINPGEIHALMGPNGSGKSTLANAMMGHPKYEITDGTILLNKKSIQKLQVHERSLAGLFLAFQHPKEISGITFEEFLLAAYRAHQKYRYPDKPPVLVFQFKKMLRGLMKKFAMDEKFAERDLNHGFSGGEKKKSEMLQMALLKPTLAIMDEADSGLDIDALKTICKNIHELHRENKKMGLLIITHQNRILNYLVPDRVHVLKQGKIVKSGGKAFAKVICKSGYGNI